MAESPSFFDASLTLKLLEISGAIVTIDAMGTQKKIAADIIEKKADYILQVKGNQPTLLSELTSFFEKEKAEDFQGLFHSFVEPTDGLRYDGFGVHLRSIGTLEETSGKGCEVLSWLSVNAY